MVDVEQITREPAESVSTAFGKPRFRGSPEDSVRLALGLGSLGPSWERAQRPSTFPMQPGEAVERYWAKDNFWWRAHVIDARLADVEGAKRRRREVLINFDSEKTQRNDAWLPAKSKQGAARGRELETHVDQFENNAGHIEDDVWEIDCILEERGVGKTLQYLVHTCSTKAGAPTGTSGSRRPTSAGRRSTSGRRRRSLRRRTGRASATRSALTRAHTRRRPTTCDRP